MIEVVNIRWATDGADVLPPMWVELTLADGRVVRYYPKVVR